MKKVIFRILTLLAILALLTCVCAAKSVIPGGKTIGLRLETSGVTVVEFSATAPEKAGLRRGDVICAVDGANVTTANALTEAVTASNGRVLALTVLRGEARTVVRLAPTQTAEGWRLGILVRDSISGIGTLTFVDPETGTFGALGHGVSDGEHLLPLKCGAVLPAQVATVVKGEKGRPGALQGAINGSGIDGRILRNTQQGIFGTLTHCSGTPMEVAVAKDVHPGPAVIRSNVRGTEVEEFQVTICAVYRDGGDRNLLLHTTDPALLTCTGGIVQGMSGSPILQDGKIIGAVTHVLVNDPTTGYGIFIENMLSAAG